jgi:hypothetical protein
MVTEIDINVWIYMLYSNVSKQHYTQKDQICMRSNKFQKQWKLVLTTSSAVYIHSGIFFHYKQKNNSDSLWAGQSGDWKSVGLKLSAPIQTSPGTHPALYTMGTESLSWA